MLKRIGRFEIRSELGRGAQSAVYLAWDSQLQREVAIKTLHFSTADPQRNATLLREARTVSRLRHPNVVPIFDAGEEGGDPYLVFEYVPGSTLERRLRDGGAYAPPVAAQVMIPVLGALASAHEEGIIHRDLKPSNILLDADGIPHVMDFGIAVNEAERHGAVDENNSLVGTPGYLPPEYISERKLEPQGDVYAAGIVLLEMLTGHRVFEDKTLPALLDRIMNVGVNIPSSLALEPQLAAIVLKACTRDLTLRYASATQMKKALEDYLHAGDTTDEANENRKQATLAFLLRRMRHKSDFPALSESVSAINRLTESDHGSITALSAAILKDYALTNKILRIANSAFYRQYGGGSISTISRAVVVLGFDAIRNIALTVILFEHLHDKGNVRDLRETFLRANLAALLARNLSQQLQSKASEQVFICALFHNLGELLALYYFPEEVEQIRRVMAQKNCNLEKAAVVILGISLEDLGIGIARTWGFPQNIVSSMRRLPDGVVRKPTTPEEHQRLIIGYANELCETVASLAPEKRQEGIRSISDRFAGGMPVSERQMKEILDVAFTELKQVASVLQANLRQSQLVRHLQEWVGAQSANQVASDPLGDTLLEDSAIPEPESAEAAEDALALTQSILTAGIQDISNSLVEERALNDILRIILETIYRAMGFKRVLLCLRDARTQAVVGRFGFGPDASEVAKHFRIPLKPGGDVFSAAVAKALDIIISDVADEKIAERIPDWFRRNVAAQTFVLLPLSLKGTSVGLIYCDKDQAGSIRIGEKELALLKTLRNQALLAIKQSA